MVTVLVICGLKPSWMKDDGMVKWKDKIRKKKSKKIWWLLEEDVGIKGCIVSQCWSLSWSLVQTQHMLGHEACSCRCEDSRAWWG